MEINKKMSDNSKFVEECTGPCDWDNLIMKRFCEFVPEDSIVADIGANHGIFTLNVLKNKKVKEIYAIEADFENFKVLKSKIDGDLNVKLINAAVTDHNGKIDIYEGNGDHATRNILGDKSFWENDNIKQIKRCTVDCATLDYIFTEKLNIKVDACKIDVEGAEVLVLKGAEKFLKNIKYDFIECHTKETYQEIVKMCLNNGWKISCLKNLHEIKNIHELDFCYQVIVAPYNINK